MKIVFVISEAENYAVQLFSALLKPLGHEVFLIFDPRLFNNDEVRNRRFAQFFNIRKENVKKIRCINPHLVGFSVYTQDYEWALGMARMIKEIIPTMPIIFGGIHCILCPEQVIREDCVDIVCVGEGEKAIVQLLTENHTEVRNLWFKSGGLIKRNGLNPLIQDLDSLPFLDRDILYEQKPVFKRDYSISTGRGCPYSCTFCASDALNRQYREKKLGKPVRQRSVENVINELMLAKEKYHPRSIYFTDDVFTLNIHWLENFSKLYSEKVNLSFYCTANPGTIKEKEIYLLKEAGCQMIGFGMQSCNEEYRKVYLKRYGTNEHIKRIAQLCRELKIYFSFDHIFNLPNEPIENQYEALRFYNETRPDIINTFTMTYLPKIELNKFLDDKTKEEVNNGKIRTGMFIRNKDYFSSMFILLPLLSQHWFTFLIKNHWRFRFPFWVRLILKDIKRLMMGRYSDVFFPIRLLLTNIKDNLLIKCGLR